jgi:hypothetical protein
MILSRRHIWQVVGFLFAYLMVCYFAMLASTAVTTEARCLELGIEKYRVTYDLQRYCVVTRNRVVPLELTEVVREQRM